MILIEIIDKFIQWQGTLPSFWKVTIGILTIFAMIYIPLWILFSLIPGTIQYIRLKLTGRVRVSQWQRRVDVDISRPGWKMYDRNWWWHINHWWAFD